MQQKILKVHISHDGYCYGANIWLREEEKKLKKGKRKRREKKGLCTFLRPYKLLESCQTITISGNRCRNFLQMVAGFRFWFLKKLAESWRVVPKEPLSYNKGFVNGLVEFFHFKYINC